jgi:hypothetical protein
MPLDVNGRVKRVTLKRMAEEASGTIAPSAR